MPDESYAPPKSTFGELLRPIRPYELAHQPLQSRSFLVGTIGCDGERTWCVGAAREVQPRDGDDDRHTQVSVRLRVLMGVLADRHTTVVAATMLEDDESLFSRRCAD